MCGIWLAKMPRGSVAEGFLFGNAQTVSRLTENALTLRGFV